MHIIFSTLIVCSAHILETIHCLLFKFSSPNTHVVFYSINIPFYSIFLVFLIIIKFKIILKFQKVWFENIEYLENGNVKNVKNSMFGIIRIKLKPSPINNCTKKHLNTRGLVHILRRAYIRDQIILPLLINQKIQNL